MAYINIITVMTSLVALEINNQNGVIPARTSQKITATAYPSRRVCYTFKLSYELFSMSGMLFNMITLHSENIHLSLSTPKAKLNWPLKRGGLCLKILIEISTSEKSLQWSDVALQQGGCKLRFSCTSWCQCPFWPYPHIWALSIVLCL